LLEFLEVIFAEVEVLVWGGVEGENVVYGLEFGDGYEADLMEAGQMGSRGKCSRGSARH